MMGWDGDHYRYQCSDGAHNSFWATVIESPEWEAWEKEVARRLTRRSELTRDPVALDKRVGKVWDVDECREVGWISPEHFYDFLKFTRSRKGRDARNEKGAS